MRMATVEIPPESGITNLREYSRAQAAGNIPSPTKGKGTEREQQVQMEDDLSTPATTQLLLLCTGRSWKSHHTQSPKTT